MTRLPTSDDINRPAPLLVVLHGDDGNTGWLDRTWNKPAAHNGVVLAVLRCPKSGGMGDPSWWRWYQGRDHDPAWLGARIDEIAREVPIDRRRTYATGYSGGASYLGYYVPTHPGRFAAVSYVAGGVNFVHECPDCKIPVHFFIGGLDTMLQSFVSPLRDWYGACGGHEVVWDVRRGVTHEGILATLESGQATVIMGWLLGHKNGCIDR